MVVHVILSNLINAHFHYGYLRQKWNPEMSPFLAGARQQIHIINLNSSIFRMKKGQLFLRECASRRLKTLFILRKDLKFLRCLSCSFGSYTFRLGTVEFLPISFAKEIFPQR